MIYKLTPYNINYLINENIFKKTKLFIEMETNEQVQMYEEVRERKRVFVNMLQQSPPNYTTFSIEYLVSNVLKKTDLKPPYQRGEKWAPEMYNAFINSIMTNGLISGLVLYQRTTEQLVDNKLYECVDGHHRLLCIYNYIHGIPINGKYIYLEYVDPDTDNIEHIFYEEKIEIIEWARETDKNFQFLTPEEKIRFDNFDIEIRVIKETLDLNKRRRIFTELQNGKQVNNSDLLRNQTHHDFIDFTQERKLEPVLNKVLEQHCWRKQKNYSVHWLVRLYYIYWNVRKNQDVKDITNAFVKKDSKIMKTVMLKMKVPSLECSEEDKDNFYDCFINFTQFLDNPMCVKLKLNPTQLFALFAHICKINEGQPNEILLSNISKWAKKGQENKLYKTMWESTPTNDRKKYFEECLNELASYITYDKEPERLPITKRMKNKVWKKYFNKQVRGSCPCCEEYITKENCVFGHIQSFATGGQTEVDNLRPICTECNGSMGIRHMDGYIYR